MQVFRAYFKVMRGSAVSIAVNLGVFLGIAVLISSLLPQAPIADFQPTRTPIAVINRDGEGQLAQGLADYLAATSQLVEYPDDAEKLQDALYFRNVEYIAIIPAGFSDAFMAGNDRPIQKVVVPGSTSSHYVDLSIDKFLNTVRLHRQYWEEESQAQLVAAARTDLAVETPVTIKASTATSNGYRPAYAFYFAYSAYALLAMIMTGVSSIMMTFNKPDLYLRNLCAPLPSRSMHLQLAAGHGVFAFGCWVVIMLGGLALYGQSVLASGLVGLYCLNTLAFTAVSACIGFLVGNWVRSDGAQAGAVNAVTMGLSFLGGVFVPQSIMSKSVLAVAKFLPSYWFVRANDAIGELSGLTADRLYPIYGSILIQLGFAVAIFSVTLLLGKERRLSHT